MFSSRAPTVHKRPGTRGQTKSWVIWVGVVRLVVRVGEDVVLPCSLGSEENIEPTLFDWTKDRQEVFLYNAGIHDSADPQFKGRVSHFPDQLIKGNASIVIRNTQLSDSGNYFCSFPRLQQQKFYVELLVGIFAKPRVMILNITKNWALLHCEVRGAFPKPHISWIDNNGRVLPAQEKLEDSDGLQLPPALMLQTNVTKTSIFHCRVAQHELNYTIEVQISTHICSDETGTGVFNGVFIILLILVVVLYCLILISYWMYRRRAMRGGCEIVSVPHPASYYQAKPQEIIWKRAAEENMKYETI